MSNGHPHTDADSRKPTRLVLSYEGDERTPVLDAVRAMAQNWKLIAVAVVIGILLGTAAFLFITPRYRVQAQYVFAGDASAPANGVAGRLGGLAALAGVNLGGAATSHSEVVAKLRSRKFVEQFLQENALLTTLFAGKWDESTKSWKDGSQPTIGDGFRKWTRSVIEVSEDKTSGLLRITLEWKDPELAAAWCAQVVKRLNDEMRADAIARADASLKYLEEELSRTSNLELREGLYTLIETTTRDRMMAVVSRYYALRPVDPPVAPEKDEEVWPVIVPFIVGGALLGFLFSIAAMTITQAARIIFGKRLSSSSAQH